jgi:hypothetical protein
MCNFNTEVRACCALHAPLHRTGRHWPPELFDRIRGSCCRHSRSACHLRRLHQGARTPEAPSSNPVCMTPITTKPRHTIAHPRSFMTLYPRVQSFPVAAEHLDSDFGPTCTSRHRSSIGAATNRGFTALGDPRAFPIPRVKACRYRVRMGVTTCDGARPVPTESPLPHSLHRVLMRFRLGCWELEVNTRRERAART